MSGGAVISDDGRHRYRLWREWGDGPAMAFVMLNPSTADAAIDDPTIRRCLGFARREGCGRIDVVNLFSWRSPRPADVVDAFEAGWDMWGPEFTSHFYAALGRAAFVVVAWGAHPAARIALRHVDGDWMYGRTLWCLGTTRDGSPRHPLYVPGSQPLVSWARP